MNKYASLRRRFFNALTTTLMTGLSLLLLVYVGFGEAQQTYRQFTVEKLFSQGRVIQNAMETFLRPGLPIRQYVGFATRAEPILSSDPTIASIAVYDATGQLVFSGGEQVPLIHSESGDGEHTHDLRVNGDHLQVVLPLKSRFETVGSLALTIPSAVIDDRVEHDFKRLLPFAFALSLLFGLFAAIAGAQLTGRGTRSLQVVYGLTFMSMAALVVATLVVLYSDGAQAKTKALANSLGQRIGDIAAFNLNISEIVGLDQALLEYRRLNPTISAAALMVDGKVELHTDPAAIGKPWIGERRTYEYTFDLTSPDSARPITLAVTVPKEIVFWQVARSVKNFLALFIASAFIAGLALQLAASMRHRAAADNMSVDGQQAREVALDRVKPVFFVAVFLEQLLQPFLPQFMEKAVVSSGLSPSMISAPFMAYYLLFALALIPAARFSKRFGPKSLMYVGLLLSAVGLMVLALPVDFVIMTAARAMSGIGQGMLFIGVQSYILATAAPTRKTQAAAIIVFGFQGGMISGTAIGSLIVVYIGAQGVFTLAAVLAILMAIYAKLVVPVVAESWDQSLQNSGPKRRFLSNLGQLVRSLDFLKAMLCVGIPAKAVMTGVVVFALPLLLTQAGFAQEDIGQVIMVYAAGVLVASVYASRRVDRTGRADIVLFLGTIASGAGLMLIGLAGWQPVGGVALGLPLSTVTMISGVLIVGLAHGFINAPVVTHVATSRLAYAVGAESATATYRFLERIGHVAGPMILGQLFFLYGGQSPVVLAWVGLAVFGLALLFLIPTRGPSEATIRNAEMMARGAGGGAQAIPLQPVSGSVQVAAAATK